ncbi:MAG TPA: YoaK family protein [Gemmataceae bacterium]|nr:YoaK family protein [Gemmataceae bacterium]
MTLSEKTTRVQGGLAVVLALIAGYIDSYTLLNYEVYASFMSGNTTQAGLRAGQGRLTEAGYHLLPIPLFVIGIIVGTFLLHSGLHHPLRLLCELVATLLAASLAAVYLDPPAGWFNIILLSLAMGVMNTIITRVGGQSVSLGFVTGDLNNLGRHLALAAKRVPVSDSQGPGDTHCRRAALLAGVWTSFLIGALLAVAAMALFGEWTLLLPIPILLVLAVFDRDTSAAERIADVADINPFSRRACRR